MTSTQEDDFDIDQEFLDEFTNDDTFKESLAGLYEAAAACELKETATTASAAASAAAGVCAGCGNNTFEIALAETVTCTNCGLESTTIKVVGSNLICGKTNSNLSETTFIATASQMKTIGKVETNLRSESLENKIVSAKSKLKTIAGHLLPDDICTEVAEMYYKMQQRARSSGQKDLYRGANYNKILAMITIGLAQKRMQKPPSAADICKCFKLTQSQHNSGKKITSSLKHSKVLVGLDADSGDKYKTPLNESIAKYLPQVVKENLEQNLVNLAIELIVYTTLKIEAVSTQTFKINTRAYGMIIYLANHFAKLKSNQSEQPQVAVSNTYTKYVTFLNKFPVVAQKMKESEYYTYFEKYV